MRCGLVMRDTLNVERLDQQVIQHPNSFFSRRNARRHLHIDVLRRAVLNVFLQQRADNMHISIFSLLDRSLPVSQNPWHRTLLISPRKV